MVIDIVEGATDKSESGLRAILSAQGKLRIFIAAPVVVIETLLYFLSPAAVAIRMVLLTVCYCAYIAALHAIGHHRPSVPARHLLVATAVIDPLALAAWMVVTGGYGAIIAGFFLFTILGFGFRTGRPLMHLCQVTAIASFVVVFLSVPYWQDNPVVWIALMVPLIAVPMYAGTLIGTLREAREHAVRESQAKSELLAKVSHELRTPLTGIISATELLVAESPNEAVQRRTETILTLSKELLREINDLLDEAKYGANALELQLAPVDLQEQIVLVRQAVQATASKKSLEFRAALDPAIQDRVLADAHHLGRVLLNLASNAVNFTERGKVRLDIGLLEQVGSEYRVRFSVSDTGIGIPESFRSKMFQPFSQVDQGPSRRYGGTGLGLALSKQLVALMGGDLTFESEVGRGSRFWFDLTLARSQATQPAAIAAPVATPEVPAPRRILVAEDNETNRMLLQELLEIDGHTVVTCDSGIAALEALTQEEFDLLLLDYNLGDMDGVRVLQTYRFGRPNGAPALFLTADTTKLTATRLREAAGAGVLYKPITLVKLRRAINEIEMPSSESGAVLEASSELSPAPRPGRPQLEAVVVSPLDRSVINELRTVSARSEFFPTLLAEAEHDMHRNCQLIREAQAGGDYPGLRDAAHALKGVSANVGAVRLVALAGQLMALPREQIDATRERWSADLGDALRMTVAAMRSEVKEAAGGSSGDPASLHLQ